MSSYKSDRAHKLAEALFGGPTKRISERAFETSASLYGDEAPQSFSEFIEDKCDMCNQDYPTWMLKQSKHGYKLCADCAAAERDSMKNEGDVEVSDPDPRAAYSGAPWDDDEDEDDLEESIIEGDVCEVCKCEADSCECDMDEAFDPGYTGQPHRYDPRCGCDDCTKHEELLSARVADEERRARLDRKQPQRYAEARRKPRIHGSSYEPVKPLRRPAGWEPDEDYGPGSAHTTAGRDWLADKGYGPRTGTDSDRRERSRARAVDWMDEADEAGEQRVCKCGCEDFRRERDGSLTCADCKRNVMPTDSTDDFAFESSKKAAKSFVKGVKTFKGKVAKAKRAGMKDPEAFAAWTQHRATGKWPREESLDRSRRFVSIASTHRSLAEAMGIKEEDDPNVLKFDDGSMLVIGELDDTD